MSIPPPPRPPRSHRLRERLLAALAFSLLVHLGIWLFAPKKAPPKKPKQEISVTLQYGKPDKANIRPPPRQQPSAQPRPVQPQITHKQERQEPTPPTTEDTHPNLNNPTQAYASEQAPREQTHPKSESGTPGSSTGPAPGAPSHPPLSMQQLLDPNALGSVVSHFRESLPDSKQFTAPNGIGDGNSAEQVKARIGARIAGDADEIEANGRVNGGLVSSCNDGHDNDHDGKIDCADLGCRLLPVCRNTKEYSFHMRSEIPDNDVRGITTEVNVDDADDQNITAVSVSIYVTHSSPGDLAVEIEHEGRKKTLQLADRDQRTFPIAFYLQEFIGTKAQGVWKVTIRDVIPGIEGRLTNWTLYVTRPSDNW